MIAIVITNSPRRRYTFHFEDSNEAKNIAYLLGQGEQWEQNLSRIETSKSSLVDLFRLKPKDYPTVTRDDEIITFSIKDRLAIKFFLNLIHRQIDLNLIENSVVVIECSTYRKLDVYKFMNTLNVMLKSVFTNLENSNVPHSEDMRDVCIEVRKVSGELRLTIGSEINASSKEKFQLLVDGLNQFRDSVKEYIQIMKHEGNYDFAIYEEDDIKKLEECIISIERRYNRLLEGNMTMKSRPLDLNKPMSSRITFFLDSDGSDFPRFLAQSKKMNISLVKNKNKKSKNKWKHDYKLDDYKLISNNNELTDSILPYIHRLGTRLEIYQKTNLCVLNGNLEIILSDKAKKAAPEDYTPKITIIQNPNESENAVDIPYLLKRINDLKMKIELDNESGPLKIRHFTNKELILIDKSLSLENADICLYLKHPRDPSSEGEIFEWVKEQDLDKLCTSNESFTYLECEYIRGEQDSKQSNVRFSRFFLDEEE